MNMVKKVEINLLENGYFEVAVTRSFAPEHGGGEQTFKEDGGRSLFRALDVAREMVTVGPRIPL